MKNNLAYKLSRESECKRLIEERDEARRSLNASPQMIEARHHSSHPDVYFHYKRKAHSAWIGALATWSICLLLGGCFTILSYSLPWFDPWLSGLIIFFVWAVVTLMIGVATEKVVEFGLNISPASPFSVGKAIKGILICGAILIFSFTGLLLLRTLISLALLIALQAVFEISAICAGSFFKAIYDFYSELPELQDRIIRLEVEIDRIKSELAMLAEDEAEAFALATSSTPSPPPQYQAQQVGVNINLPPGAVNRSQNTHHGHVTHTS